MKMAQPVQLLVLTALPTYAWLNLMMVGVPNFYSPATTEPFLSLSPGATTTYATTATGCATLTVDVTYTEPTHVTAGAGAVSISKVEVFGLGLAAAALPFL